MIGKLRGPLAKLSKRYHDIDHKVQAEVNSKSYLDNELRLIVSPRFYHKKRSYISSESEFQANVFETMNSPP